MNRTRIAYLWECYINEVCSKQEKDEFFNLLQDIDCQEYIQELIQKSFEEEDLYTALPDSTKERIVGIIVAEDMVAHTTSRRIVLWPWISIAAAMMLVGSWLFFRPNSTPAVGTDVARVNLAPQDEPIHATGAGAVLSFADGTHIDLSEQQTGIKVQSEGFHYDNGELLAGSEAATDELKWQDIRTAKGGQYQIELEDGTKIWLNAASTLRFPSTFKDAKLRVVELEGEAYFEVNKKKHRNAAVPFVVKSKNQEIQVLGTAFNVQAYQGQATSRTTLLEGAVKVKSGSHSSSLLPGQQAVLLAGKLQVKQVNTLEYTSWKDGEFYINNQPLAHLIPALENWYDVDIVCNEAVLTKPITLRLSRDKSLNSLLKILEESIGVKYRVEGRRVNIYP